MDNDMELFRNHEIHVECRPGLDVDRVAEETVKLAKKYNMNVVCEFNGIILRATPKTKATTVARLYGQELMLSIKTK